MRRRIVILSALIAGTLGAGVATTGAVAAPTTTANGYWACVGSEVLDKGLCLRNPFPERLPVPQLPTVTAPPTGTPA